MTVIAGFDRCLLLLFIASLPLLLAQPGFGDNNSKFESQIESSKIFENSNNDNATKSESDKPISVDLSKDQAKLSETQNQYLGNKFSRKYHLKGCHFAHIADPANIFPFASCKEAIKSNYRPCNWCLPKWQKFVKGQIIGLPIKREADAKKSQSQ